MNHKIWRILVAAVVLIFLSSYFLLFKTGQTDPYLFHLPYVFWVSILLTVLLVVCTFIGAKFSPFKNDDKS